MIPGRATRRRGVIMEWDLVLLLKDLADAMERLVSLERMKKRYIFPISKEGKIKYLDKVIVTYGGNYLPRHVLIYEGMIALRIRPYIEPVQNNALIALSLDI